MEKFWEGIRFYCIVFALFIVTPIVCKARSDHARKEADDRTMTFVAKESVPEGVRLVFDTGDTLGMNKKKFALIKSDDKKNMALANNLQKGDEVRRQNWKTFVKKVERKDVFWGQKSAGK